MRLGADDSILIDRKYMKQIALSAQEIMQNKCQCDVFKSDGGRVSTAHAACGSVGGREGEEVQGKPGSQTPLPALQAVSQAVPLGPGSLRGRAHSISGGSAKEERSCFGKAIRKGVFPFD